jgi:hypothetical protein
MRWALAVRATLLLGMLAGWGSAQTFPFQLRLTSTNAAVVVPNGATIPFSAAIGQSQTFRLTATYNGSGRVTVPQSPQVFGSTDFTAPLSGTPPLTLNPGDSLIVDLQYRPSTATGANAQFSLPFTETTFTTNPPTVSQNQISLNLQGAAPSFTLSYVLQSTLNTVALQPGGTIPFPPTLINTISQANLNISNLGSGSGQVTNVTMTGSPTFTLVGLPLFPVTLTSGQQLPLLIHYLPTAVESDSAQIQISFDSGTPVTVNLQGTGVSPMFSYNVLQGAQSTPVTPPGPISLPDTNVGSSSSVVIQVKNTGNTTGTINSPPTGAGPFQITGLPLFPQVLTPNSSFPFTLTFVPTQPGNQTGQLLIGADLFTVNGNGLGSNIVYSYVSGATTTTLGPNNTAVIFSPTAISQTSQLNFIITNTGTTNANVSNIVIGEPNSPFALSGPPNLPTTLGPGQTAQFNINFTPTTVGLVNGTLHVDTTTIPLVGSGTAPPTLPAYTIQGPSRNVAPQSQPTISLKLASPYPLALTGVLTLSTSGNLVNDPAFQFLTGGQTVAFVIPANSTDANFANQGPLLHMQIGTVATTITLTPTFATQAGNVSVTPASPTTLLFAVAPAAPVLLTVVPVNESASSFALNLTGYSTTRTLTSVTLQFTAAASMTLGTTQVTINIQPAATLWFQSTASQAFGGQFTVTLPFTLQGTPPTGETLLQTIASISATVSNEVGTSNSVVTPLP